MKAIETQDKAVIVPIPWEIIKVGGTIIDKGLIDVGLIFRKCTVSKRPINKTICLEFIVGASFLEIYKRIPQHINISKKFMISEIIKLKLFICLVTNSYEVVVEIIIKTNKIKNLSIFFKFINFWVRAWLLIHK